MNKLLPISLLFALIFVALFSMHLKQPEMLGQSNLDFKQDTRKPQRIVSMSPGNTEILFALGAGDRVVGVTSYSDYPEEAKSKESIGAYNAPDVEKIVSLAPDLVLALGEIQANYVHTLQQAGIQVIVIEPHTLPEILAAIQTISVAVGEQERGAALYEVLVKQMDEVAKITTQLPRKRVFLEVWDAPLLTVGRSSFINDLLQQAGGINVAADRKVDYTPCDIETLYAYNPDVYIVIGNSRGEPRSFVASQQLADLAAVKNQQVFQLVDDVLARPGPRCFVGLVQLAQILHPEEMQAWRIEGEL